MSVKDSAGEKGSAVRANIFAGARGGAGAMTVPLLNKNIILFSWIFLFFFANVYRMKLQTAPHLSDEYDKILVLQNGVLFNI